MLKGIITIDNGHYDESVNGGCAYIGVSFEGHNEGSSSPCDSEEEARKKIRQIILYHINYNIKIIDNRIKQATLF